MATCPHSLFLLIHFPYSIKWPFCLAFVSNKNFSFINLNQNSWKEDMTTKAVDNFHNVNLKCYRSRAKLSWTIFNPSVAIIVLLWCDLTSFWPLGRSLGWTHRWTLRVHQPKGKECIREHLRPVAKIDPLCCKSSTWYFHQRIWKMSWLFLFYDFKKFMRLLLHWNMKLEITWVCVPRLWILIIHSRMVYLLSPLWWVLCFCIVSFPCLCSLHTCFNQIPGTLWNKRDE